MYSCFTLTALVYTISLLLKPTAFSIPAASMFLSEIAGINTAFPVRFLMCVLGLPSMDRYRQAFHLSTQVDGIWFAMSESRASTATCTASCVFARIRFCASSSLIVICGAGLFFFARFCKSRLNLSTSFLIYVSWPIPPSFLSMLIAWTTCPALVASIAISFIRRSAVFISLLASAFKSMYSATAMSFLVAVRFPLVTCSHCFCAFSMPSVFTFQSAKFFASLSGIGVYEKSSFTMPCLISSISSGVTDSVSRTVLVSCLTFLSSEVCFGTLISRAGFTPLLIAPYFLMRAL